MPISAGTARLVTPLGGATKHGSLIAALGEPDAERALERAMPVVMREDDGARLGAVARALARCGVAGLAARLLRSKREVLAGGAELRSLLVEIEALPSGAVSRAELGARYGANRRALVGKQAELGEVLAGEVELPRDVHVYVTAGGSPQVVREAADEGLVFVFPFGDHRQLAEGVQLGRVPAGASFLLRGVPSARLLQRLLRVSTPHGYRPPIDIVEGELEALRIWLHVVEDAGLLADARVHVFAGEGAVQGYERFRVAHLDRHEPTHVITSQRSGGRAPVLDEGQRGRVALVVGERRAALFGRQEELYGERTWRDWARRYARAGREEPALRVLGVTSRFSTYIRHSMRDLAAALRRRGCEVDLVQEGSACAADVDLWTTLAARPYDLVVVMNHLRSEFPDRIHRRVPYVCWIQDWMERVRSREAGRSVGAFDLVMAHGAGELHLCYEYPEGRLLGTTAVTDPRKYHAEAVDEGVLAPYRCDVSYVSHASATPEQLIEGLAREQGAAFGAFLRRMLEGLRERMQEAAWVPFAARLSMALEAEGRCAGLSFTAAQRHAVVYPVVMTLYDRLMRHETLAWVAAWAEARGRELRLFGRGWENHPTLKRYACGEIENGEALRWLYRATKVNLQVSGYATLHQRLLDGLASGGFFVTRYHPRDFVRRPKAALRELVGREGMTSLDELLIHAASSSQVRALIEELHRLDHRAIASAEDPARRREARVLREVMNYGPEMLDDAAVLREVRSKLAAPRAGSGDLPGFGWTVFRSSAELHGLLDDYVDDEGRRNDVAGPMRAWVVKHATYDELAARMVDHFRARFGREACGGNGTAFGE